MKYSTSVTDQFSDGKEQGLRDATSALILLRERFYEMKDTRAVNVLDRAIKEVKGLE